MYMGRREAVNDITLFDAFLFCLCLYQTKTVYLYLSAFFYMQDLYALKASP